MKKCIGPIKAICLAMKEAAVELFDLGQTFTNLTYAYTAILLFASMLIFARAFYKGKKNGFVIEVNCYLVLFNICVILYTWLYWNNVTNEELYSKGDKVFTIRFWVLFT